MDSETDVRIAELGYELPAVSAPLASYTSFCLLYTSDAADE